MQLSIVPGIDSRSQPLAERTQAVLPHLAKRIRAVWHIFNWHEGSCGDQAYKQQVRLLHQLESAFIGRDGVQHDGDCTPCSYVEMKRSRRRGSPTLRNRFARSSGAMLRIRSRNMAEKLNPSRRRTVLRRRTCSTVASVRAQPDLSGSAADLERFRRDIRRLASIR